MSRKKKPARTPSHARSPKDREDRGSVGLTVAWMLTALATAAALIVSALGRYLIWQFPPQSDDLRPVLMIPGLFMLVAVMTGLLCLILTPVVYRVRAVPPPRQIAIAAVVISLLPLVTAVWLYVLP